MEHVNPLLKCFIYSIIFSATSKDVKNGNVVWSFAAPMRDLGPVAIVLPILPVSVTPPPLSG